LAAPKDGGTVALFGSDIAMIALLGTNPSVQLDPRKFTWLGSSSSFGHDAYVLVVRADAKSPTIAAARRKDAPPLLLGGTGEGARDADVPKILRDALGLGIKQVLGYPDSPSLLLAVERGELEGRMFDFSWIRKNRPASPWRVRSRRRREFRPTAPRHCGRRSSPSTTTRISSPRRRASGSTSARSAPTGSSAASPDSRRRRPAWSPT
jgi:hypothetical protein